MIPPDKLIRDKYNEIIEPCRLKIVDHPAERFILLIKKIKEELNELEETAYNDVNEYADVIETLYAMADFQGVSRDEIEIVRLKKLEKRGGFSKGLVLIG